MRLDLCGRLDLNKRRKPPLQKFARRNASISAKIAWPLHGTRRTGSAFSNLTGINSTGLRNTLLLGPATGVIFLPIISLSFPATDFTHPDEFSPKTLFLQHLLQQHKSQKPWDPFVRERIRESFNQGTRKSESP